MTVTIKLQQPDGTLIASFPGEDNISICQTAGNHNIEIPVACSSGFCGSCTCQILSGSEHIQIDKISPPVMPLERNEDGSFQEFFACIGGITKEALKDKEDHVIILEKYM